MALGYYKYQARERGCQEWAEYTMLARNECDFHRKVANFMKEDRGFEYKVSEQIKKVDYATVSVVPIQDQDWEVYWEDPYVNT